MVFSKVPYFGGRDLDAARVIVQRLDRDAAELRSLVNVDEFFENGDHRHLPKSEGHTSKSHVSLDLWRGARNPQQVALHRLKGEPIPRGSPLPSRLSTGSDISATVY